MKSFLLVVRHTSIRVLLAIVAAEDMELEQMDVKTAFLHGELEDDIYMAQPEEFVAQGKEQHVCKLKKSLYGLKQSPRRWYMRFDKFMLDIGYERSIKDQCVYVCALQGGGHIYLLLYVDDMLIASKDKEEVKHLKSRLAEEFNMKDLGPAKKILGMEILRDRNERTLRLSQEAYVKKVLARFGMEGCKTRFDTIGATFQIVSIDVAYYRSGKSLYGQGTVCKCSGKPNVCYGVHKARFGASSWSCQSIYGKSWQATLASHQMDTEVSQRHNEVWIVL